MKNKFFCLWSVVVCIVLISLDPARAQTTYTWNGGNGSWHAPANWTPNGLPGANDTAVINAGTVQVTDSITVSNFTINGGTLTHPQGNTNGVQLNVAGTLTVAAGGSIDVTGAGYLGGIYPGNTFGVRGETRGPGGVPAAGSAANSGGSYGSLGGGGQANSLYGSETAPGDLGSGGASDAGHIWGGFGGGRMELRAQSLVVDGALRANGSGSYNTQNGLLSDRGGGSGGSIYVVLSGGTFSGNGVIEAKGGPSANPNLVGGGGRIALVGFANNSFAGTLGRAGTIFTQTTNTGGHLQLDGASLSIAANTTNTYSSLSATTNGGTIYNSGTLAMSDDTLVIGPGLSLMQNGVVKGASRPDDWIGALTVQSNGLIWHSQGYTNGVQLKVAGTLHVQAGGSINVSGAGYRGARYPGNTFGARGETRGDGGLPAAGSAGNSGGSYGSLGGGGQANSLYGSETAPVDLGSGGASDPDYIWGGMGGGRMELRANSLVVDGQLLANGGASYYTLIDTSPWNRGGGSGGSIYVVLNGGTFAGNGLIEAKGGPSTGPAEGGGGRIAVVGCFSKSFSGDLTNTGTIYLNRCPVLPLQNDRTMDELTTLVVTNTAYDEDLTNALTYSLLAAPASATISTNGVIQWLPLESDGPSTNTFITVVWDDAKAPLSATNSSTVIVNEINLAPALTLPPNTNVNELVAFTATATATDPDIPINPLTFALVSGPTGLTVSPDGTINWIPGEAQGPGTHLVTISVTDTNPPAVNATSLSVTSSFSITVNEVNVAPVPTLPGDTNIDEQVEYVANATATDSDLPVNELTFALVSGPAGLTVSSTGAINWTPDETQVSSTNPVVIRVTDLNPPAVNTISFSVTNSYEIVVNEINVPPVLPGIADTNVNELVTLTVTNTATDSDLPVNPLTYTLMESPSGAAIDTNGVITWTPTEAQGPSTNTFTTVVMDTNSLAVNAQSFSTTNTFSVLVNEVNVAPVLTLPPTTNINELVAFTANATAIDADLPINVLTFTKVSGPATLTVSPSGVINWTPAENEGPGTNTVTISVTDTSPAAVNATSFSTTNSFQIVVREVNVAPVLTLPPLTNINELVAFTANATATDSDLPTNALVFAKISGPATLTVSSSGVINWTPSENDGPSTNTVTISVTDTNAIAVNATSFSVTNSFQIVVREVNVAPVLTLPPLTNINELVAFTANATATDSDIPTNALVFAKVSGPPTLTVSSSGLINWTPSENDGPSTNTVTISVTDTNAIAVNSTSLSVTNSFQIVVREVNVAPVLTLPPLTNINELVAFTANATATDSDIPTNALVFAKISGPPTLTVSSSGVINWTPAENEGPGTNTVTISVTDTNAIAVNATSLSTTNSFQLVVNEVNVAPVLGMLIDRTVNPGEVINITATATDADVPTNTMVFDLLSSPPQAVIGATSGFFTWRPPVSMADTTNTVQVRVRDNGSPISNDVKSFTVVVNPLLPVILTPISFSNGQFRFEVNGTAGPDYIVSASSNLIQWSDIFTNLSPALPFQFNDASAGLVTNSLYRVRLQP